MTAILKMRQIIFVQESPSGKRKLSMHKRALVRRIGLFLCRGWAQHIVGRWRNAVSPGSPPSVSENLVLLPCDFSTLISRSTVLSRGLNVPRA